MRKAATIFILTLIVGCQIQSSKKVVEPPTIVIRNSCQRDLSQVTLKEPRAQGQPVSLGRISPVLRAAPFVYRRPSNPPPLLRLMRVVWTEERGKTYSDYVALDEVLSQATGQPDEALVFELHPAGRVQVYLANFPANVR